MWAEFSSELQFTTREIELLVDLAEGFSGSDINEVCVRLHRRRITRKEFPSLKDSFQVLQNLGIGEGEDRRFLSILRGKDKHAISTMLRERNAKLYSHSALADLFGVSKATAHRWAKGVKTDG